MEVKKSMKHTQSVLVQFLDLVQLGLEPEPELEPELELELELELD